MPYIWNVSRKLLNKSRNYSAENYNKALLFFLLFYVEWISLVFLFQTGLEMCSEWNSHASLWSLNFAQLTLASLVWCRNLPNGYLSSLERKLISELQFRVGKFGKLQKILSRYLVVYCKRFENTVPIFKNAKNVLDVLRFSRITTLLPERVWLMVEWGFREVPFGIKPKRTKRVLCQKTNLSPTAIIWILVFYTYLHFLLIFFIFFSF